MDTRKSWWSWWRRETFQFSAIIRHTRQDLSLSAISPVGKPNDNPFADALPFPVNPLLLTLLLLQIWALIKLPRSVLQVLLHWRNLFFGFSGPSSIIPKRSLIFPFSNVDLFCHFSKQCVFLLEIVRCKAVPPLIPHPM